MAEVDDEVNKMDEMIKKLNKCNNNVKLILELLKKMDEKKESKETADDKKTIGRPVGDFETKRKQYLEMLNSKRIKQPKETPIQYYKIDYNEDTETYS